MLLTETLRKTRCDGVNFFKDLACRASLFYQIENHPTFQFGGFLSHSGLYRNKISFKAAIMIMLSLLHI